MQKSKKVIYIVVLIIFAILIPVFAFCGFLAEGSTGPNRTTLEINNNTTFSILLEAKCDWQPTKGEYKYFNRFVINRKSKYNFVVPSNLKFCDLWPIKSKLVGSF